MIEAVEHVFDNRLREVFKTKPDVLKFLLNHERKKVCLENLCEQILLVDAKKNGLLKAPQYRQLIDSIADVFASVALNAKQNELMSAAEKRRLEAEASREKTLDEEIKELEVDGVIKPIDI